MSRLLVAVAGLVAVGTACQGTSDQTRFRESLPAFEDVQFIRMETYPLNPETPLPLTPDANGERIRWILEQLRNARISGLPVDQQGLRHATPVLQMYLPNSTDRFNIFPAVDCRSPHEGQYNCLYNTRDVVVNKGYSFWRLIAPDLAAYRWTGWQSETRMVSQDEYRAFMERQFPEPDVPTGDPTRIWVTASPGNEPVALPLVAGNGTDIETIRRVAAWVRDAQPGSAETTDDTLFRGPPIPSIAISWGEVGVTVRAAWLCSENSSCTRSPDEVLVDDFRGFRGPYHLRSPELAGWLASGYLQDMRMGTYAEYEREAHW